MNRKLIPIILVNFVNVLGFTLLFPILPEIVENLAPPVYVGILYGAILSSYSLFQFIGAPILGSLSDKYGRKPILFLSQFGTLLSWVILGASYFMPNYQILHLSAPLLVIFLSRIVDGATGGNISVANAWVSDTTEHKERTQAYGTLGATFGLGFLLGPALGGFTASTSIGYLGTTITAFFISLITLLLIHFYLPESLPKSKRRSDLNIKLWKEINVLNKIRTFKDNQKVKDLLFLGVFIALVFAAYTSVITLYIKDAYKFNPAEIGLTLSVIGLFSIFNQTVVIRKLTKVFEDEVILFLGITLIIIGLALLPFSGQIFYFMRNNFIISFTLFIIFSYIINLGLSSILPSFKSLITKNVGPKHQGIITGLDSSIRSMGNAVTPFAAGAIFTYFSVMSFPLFAVFLLIPTIYFFLKLEF